MHYTSSSLGPSPFITSSLHHYHSNSSKSNLHHYNTNSYTNGPTFPQTYSKSTINSNTEQKYFPKDLIKILPGISNLPSSQQQKIINPLNAYPMKSSMTSSGMYSTLKRQQSSYGNKHIMTSSLSSFTDTLIDELSGDKFINKMQNPFQKKYLLSQKNRELQMYASYSTFNADQYSKPTTNNNLSGKYEPTKQKINYKEMGEGMLRLAKKYGPQNAQKQQKKQQQLKYKMQDSPKRQKNYYKLVQDAINKTKNQNNDIVESQVDQTQFDSFGKGKEGQNHQDSLKQLKNLRAQSLINDLTKMVNNQEKYKNNVTSRQNYYQTDRLQRQRQRHISNYNQQAPSKSNRNYGQDMEIQRQKQYQSKNSTHNKRVRSQYVGSDDEQVRNSGTFRMVESGPQQYNNRLPSALIRRGKGNYQQKNKSNFHENNKYSKDSYAQVGKQFIPPSRISFRGKTYERIHI